MLNPNTSTSLRVKHMISLNIQGEIYDLGPCDFGNMSQVQGQNSGEDNNYCFDIKPHLIHVHM